MGIACGAPLKSTIKVIWQLCESTSFQPDLVQISEMDPEARESKLHKVHLKLRHLKQIQATEQRQYKLKFELYNAAQKDPVKFSKSSPGELTVRDPKAPEDKAEKSYKMATWAGSD